MTVQIHSGNEMYFDWPAPETPAREVWYAVVTHPSESLAFWWRYTLLQTDGMDTEARVWAAVTDRRPGRDSMFFTEPFELKSLEFDTESFGLRLHSGCEIRDGGSSGQISQNEGTIQWDFEYEPDSLTFTPIRDESIMRTAAKQLGTGCHWSANQSLSVDGTLVINGERFVFQDAPGHQGHTAGTSTPSQWIWAHCNSFDEDVSIEALCINERVTPLCLRLPSKEILINKQEDVFGDGVVETVNTSSEEGVWEFEGTADGVQFEARFDADNHRQCVSYRAPDETLRYNTHCSVTSVELLVDGAEYTTDGGRIEWVHEQPPYPGDFRPFDADSNSS